MAEEKRKLRKWIKKKLKKQQDMNNPREADVTSEIEVLESIKYSVLKRACIYTGSELYYGPSHPENSPPLMKAAITSAVKNFDLALEYMRKAIAEEEGSSKQKDLFRKKNEKLYSAKIYEDSAVYGMRLDSLENHGKKFKEGLRKAYECHKEIERLQSQKKVEAAMESPPQ